MALSLPLQNLSAVISRSGNATTPTARPPRGRHWAVHVAALVQMGGYEEGKLERPKWVGETPLSRIVQALISFKPVFSVLKHGSRRALISTAKKNNIPWRQMAKEILESESLVYPDCCWGDCLIHFANYLNPFHAYDDGNLTWLVCGNSQQEAEAATMSIARRAVSDASSTQEAIKILRGNWLLAIEQHHIQYSESSVINDILDIGCSIGISTRYLADKFLTAKVTGLDLSPYFLAVAKHKEKRAQPRKFPIRWIHAKGEDTGLPSKSFNLVSIAFVLYANMNFVSLVGVFGFIATFQERCHTTEIANNSFFMNVTRVIVNIVREAFCLLWPGGTLALIDSSELSPVLFTLYKCTEPFIDEFYLTDMDETLREAG
ncbi:hypothetical protein AAZX31_12G115900 [Glycine max]